MTHDLFPLLPDHVTESTVTLDGVSLRILRTGAGQPLLFIPGWTCTADYFVHQLDGLSRSFDVIAVDPRGHGGSSKELTGNTFRQRGVDLANLIEALDLEDVILAGWSFGVLDALSYVRQHGLNKVSKVILIDETPKVPADPNDPSEWGEAPLAHDGIVLFLRLMIDSRADFWAAYAVDMLGLPEGTGLDHPAVRRVYDLGMQAPEHVAVTTAADGLTSDYSAEAALAAEERPTLFIANDSWAEEGRRWVNTNMPGARFERMSVHMGFMTEPEEFNALITDFAGPEEPHESNGMTT